MHVYTKFKFKFSIMSVLHFLSLYPHINLDRYPTS